MIETKVTLTVSEGGLVREGFGDFNGSLSLADLFAFTKQTLILTSFEVLREEQAIGFDPTPVIAVDGVIGKSPFNVNPLGTIDIVARADMGDILLTTYQGLLDRSPVLTGRYKSSNYVFWNGKQVATDMTSLRSWIEGDPQFNDKDLIRFANLQPYARKLERTGVTADRTKTRLTQNRRQKSKGTFTLAPNGDYFLTARTIRAKYSRNSIIRFEFISGSQLGLSGSFAPNVKTGKPGRAYLYPSILISVQESGIT